MKPWVLVDISYLAHRARYATADLQWEDFNTGVLFGFWEQLRTICSDEHIRSNRVAFFFDSRQSYRRRDYPPYKGSRRQDLTPEERQQHSGMREQVQLLRREILPAIGFPVYRQTGCESDDLMAMAAEQLTKKDEPGIIVTADGDLWQCISSCVNWYDPARRKLYDTYTFLQNKSISPYSWGTVKAMAGCSGDDVAGIPGVGEKTAIRYMTHPLPAHYKTYKAIRSEEGQRVYRRNLKLVVLPHSKTKPIKLREPEYNTEAFYHYCERYGFLTYLKEPKRNEWEAFFHDQQAKTRKRKKK